MDNLEDVYARLSVHEYLLEIIVANNFASLSDPLMNWEIFRTNFINNLKYAANENAESELSNRVHEKALEMAENLLNKTESRLKEIVSD